MLLPTAPEGRDCYTRCQVSIVCLPDSNKYIIGGRAGRESPFYFSSVKESWQAAGWDRCPSTGSAFLPVREVAAYVEPYRPLTPHDLQIETQTGVCAYCFLVLSSRNEYIPDSPVNDAEWAAYQVPLTLSSISLTFCNIHRPQSPSSTSSSSTSLPVSISHSF